jgi:hypothetical protein
VDKVHLLSTQLGGFLMHATLDQTFRNWAYKHTHERVNLVPICLTPSHPPLYAVMYAIYTLALHDARLCEYLVEYYQLCMLQVANAI